MLNFLSPFKRTQSDTGIKSTAADTAKGFAQRNALQLCTMEERFFSHIRNFSAEFNFNEPAAICKRTRTDGFHRRTEVNIQQRFALIEGLIAHRANAISQIYVQQRRASGKCRIGQCKYAVPDDCFTKRNTGGKDTVSQRLNAVSHLHACQADTRCEGIITHRADFPAQLQLTERLTACKC